MPSSVPAVKAGLAAFLRSTTGLRATDGVTVRASAPDNRERALQLVALLGVTTSQTQAGLQRRQEQATLTCLIEVVTVGVGDSKATEARDRAYELEGFITAALAADRTAAGTVPPPGQLAVTGSTLQEFPTELGETGSAARVAQIELSVGWTSHVV